MKKRLPVAVSAIILALLFCPALKAGTMEHADAKIKKALQHLGGEAGDCKKGFVIMVDAIVTILPQTTYPEQVKKKLVKANDLYRENGINLEGNELLNEAYRSINDGRAYAFPKIKTIDDARDLAIKNMTLARKELKKGRVNDAAKRLLGIAIMVVTPVEK